MRRRQQLPSSPSDSDGSDTESCFDTEYEETDAETEPTDVDSDVDEDGEADLPGLEWIAQEDNVDAVPRDVDTESDLAWIAGEENAYPPEYYLDQESEDEDEDYSDGSLLLIDMIEGQFDRYIPYSLLACYLFSSRAANLTLLTDIVDIYERILPR